MKKGSGRKFGRTPSHRWAMMRNMVTSLIEHERIVTTTAKAKELQLLAEKLITTAKKPILLTDDAVATVNNATSISNSRIDRSTAHVHARRQIGKIVRTPTAQSKLMYVLGPRYAYRTGGYTRVLKLSKPRKGDNADMSVIEYIDRPGEVRAARPPTAFQQQQLQMQKQQQEEYDTATTTTTTVLGGETLHQIMQRLGLNDEFFYDKKRRGKAEKEKKDDDDDQKAGV